MIIKRIALALLLTSCSAQAAQTNSRPVDEIEQVYSAAQEERGFNEWLTGFKAQAVKSGISTKTVNSAFANVKLNERIVALDRKQPEKKLTKEEYLANVINQARIDKGRRLLAENRNILNQISAQTGVEPEFIVALWGLESNFGERQGNFSIINALATLAYEGRRRQFFETELLSALLIIDAGHTTAEAMKGSWAGAMGQCQFMPSSFLSYAVDYNGDGRIDIWSTREDVFGSIANYLATVGWGPSEEAKTKTLMHWNRSTYFVASVFQLAESIK